MFFGHPPKPILALTLAVTGHRPVRPGDPPGGSAFDEAAVADALGRALDAVLVEARSGLHRHASVFAPAPPALSLVGALAEGADAIAAEAALARGLAVDAILPMPVADYEATFGDASHVARFRALLARARAILVLPREGGEPGRAFEAAGFAALGQADLLIAVWDGKRSRGRGGTGDVVAEAARRGVTVLRIDPVDGATTLLASADDHGAVVRPVEDIAPVPVADGLAAAVDRLVRPPRDAAEARGLALFLGSWHFPLKRAPGAPAPGDAKAANAEAEARLAALTHGAGAVAAGCARRYRAAYSLSFALGAAGAAAVAAATAFPVRRRAAAIELAAVALVVAISGLAAWRQWHRRWLEAREVAERLRSSAPFWPLGIWPQAPSDEQPRWTGWFVRAAIRELPVFSGDLGAEMPEVRARASALVAGQLAYHRDRIARRSRRDALFKWMGYACLAGGAALAAADLADAAFSSATPARATSVLLPALGATLFGLRLFSGAEDEVRRSERCVGELAGLERAFADDAPGDLETLRARVRDLERVMSSDVEVWRAVYESRRLGAA